MQSAIVLLLTEKICLEKAWNGSKQAAVKRNHKAVVKIKLSNEICS